MRSTFRILFYLNRQKIKANGKCPIMGRITIDGKTCSYSTGLDVCPELWDIAGGKVTNNKQQELKAINERLDELVKTANDAYKKNIQTIGYVTAEIIRNVITGRAQPKQTLLTLFDEHNNDFEKRIGIDRKRSSLNKYIYAQIHVCGFLQREYKTTDISLQILNYEFLEKFDFYLSTILGLSVSTCKEYLIALWKVARLAVSQRTIKRDPFIGYKIQQPRKKHRNLNIEQLNKIMSAELETYKLCHTRDLFVFSCFTGLGRADLANLSRDQIITKKNGSKWIQIKRQKTNISSHIKLLDIPLRIMQKYEGEGENGKVFYVPSNFTLSETLIKLEKICNLDQHITFYMARHTFATESLTNGVPLETISRMLGHTSIKTTEIYAEITNKKIREDLIKLSERTKNVYTIPNDNMPLYQPKTQKNIQPKITL